MKRRFELEKFQIFVNFLTTQISEVIIFPLFSDFSAIFFLIFYKLSRIFPMFRDAEDAVYARDGYDYDGYR